MPSTYKKIVLSLSLIVSLILFTAGASGSMFNGERLLDVDYKELTPNAKREVDCLAENIYHEARAEGEKGQTAVALVTMNRVNDERFPKKVCEVVKQKTNGTCQFSWFCMKVALNKRSEDYQEALKTALYVYANYDLIEDFTKGSLYYHADYVRPGWKLLKTVVIGRHIFYREGGKHYDAKAKSTTEGRKFTSFLFSDDGRDKSRDLQASNRMDF